MSLLRISGGDGSSPLPISLYCILLFSHCLMQSKNDTRIETVKLRVVPENSFQKGVQAWPRRFKRRIRLKRYYFEGDIM